MGMACRSMGTTRCPSVYPWCHVTTFHIIFAKRAFSVDKLVIAAMMNRCLKHVQDVWKPRQYQSLRSVGISAKAATGITRSVSLVSESVSVGGTMGSWAKKCP